ncbi:acyltransferase family protein [Virgibacillus flavescens]|uniref:acyltransferase family protein n=1 Tax=Virgibacillus flavescens TaxID=1611422 RepID=UPI003D34A7CA
MGKKLYSNFSKANQLLEGNVSVYLDFIRGISAILVVMEHLSSRLFVGYGNVQNPDIFTKVLYLLNMLGGPAVIIFFVLSGLFISRSVLKAIFGNRWTWRSYLTNRFSRLFVVLIPALLLTLILDSIAVKFFEYQMYEQASANLMAFLGNLLFLQNIFVGVYGSNAPLWSLNYEFWYYMLFPLLLLLFFRKGKASTFIYLGITLLIVSAIGTRMNLYFLIWLIGTSVLLLPKLNIFKRGVVPIIALLLLFIAIPVRPLVMTGRLFTNGWTEDLFFVDFFVAITFGFFIYALLHYTSIRFKKRELRRFGRFSRLIAGFSFSLYLIHYPIINAVYRWVESNGYKGLEPGIVSIGVELVLVVLICIIAYCFSRFTEAKTPIIRNLIDSRISSFVTVRNKKVLKKQKVAG